LLRAPGDIGGPLPTFDPTREIGEQTSFML
jgi:hypothetical protein